MVTCVKLGHIPSVLKFLSLPHPSALLFPSSPSPKGDFFLHTSLALLVIPVDALTTPEPDEESCGGLIYGLIVNTRRNCTKPYQYLVKKIHFKAEE